MRRTSLIPLCLVALGPVALGGCSALENLGGGKKFSPDEFKIVSHSPLTMPPNDELRPPRPGEPRPQEVTPADQAKEALSPTLAGRVQARVSGQAPSTPGNASEQALVAKASAGGVDPNIRGVVNKDTKTLADNNKTFIDSLIFWQDKPPPGTIIDPTKEQHRIRDPQASGHPSPAPTPTTNPRKRALPEALS